jgi:multiple antibiotic resistance protein
MIWVTIEPVSTAVLFATLTGRLSREEQHRVAFKATTYSAAILLASIVGGQILLSAMNIQLISLQVAGGVILFLFALQVIFGKTASFTEQPEAGRDIAVFPLAIPSIVGAEAIMVVVVLTDYHLYTFTFQALTSLMALLVLLATWGMMLLATRILRVIGQSGAMIIERVNGMILAALAVELVMEALGVARWINK